MRNLEDIKRSGFKIIEQKRDLNTHKTHVCHKYIFNGTLLNRQ